MNPATDRDREPLAIEMLATDHQRRPIGLERMQFESERRVTIEEHADFLKSIAPSPPPRDDVDPIDELVAELRSFDEAEGQAVS